MDQNNMGGMGKTCNCQHHRVIPMLIALFGLAFLLEALNVISAHLLSIVWPIIVIAGGLTKLGSRSCGCC